MVEDMDSGRYHRLGLHPLTLESGYRVSLVTSLLLAGDAETTARKRTMLSVDVRQELLCSTRQIRTNMDLEPPV